MGNVVLAKRPCHGICTCTCADPDNSVRADEGGPDNLRGVYGVRSRISN